MSTEEEFTNNLKGCRNLLLSVAINKKASQYYQEAEDVVQAASIIMWKKYNTFDPATDFKLWAYAFVVNVLKNKTRACLRNPVEQDQQLYDAAAEELYSSEADDNAKALVESLLAQLDEEERKLLQAVYVDGDSIEAWAKAHGKHKQTVYNQLYLLKNRLKKQLNNE